MRKRYWHRLAYLSFLVAVFCIAGCKKNVAAAPPAPLPVEPVPAPPPPAPAITLRAAPAAIDRGQSTSLEWEAKNATSVRIQPEVGNVQLQGSRSVAPASSVTYTATATGPGGSASDTARVTVSIPAAVAPARPEPRSEARSSMGRKYWPVAEIGVSAMASGGPSAMTLPPLTPPPGPRSMTQSAVLMTSRLCSTTMTVLPRSTSRCSTSSSL